MTLLERLKLAFLISLADVLRPFGYSVVIERGFTEHIGKDRWRVIVPNGKPTWRIVRL